MELGGILLVNSGRGSASSGLAQVDPGSLILHR